MGKKAPRTAENNDKEECGNTKGYDQDELCAMIQGLTLNMDNFMADIRNKVKEIKDDMIDAEDLNRATDEFDAGVKAAIDLATEEKDQATDAKKEATKITENAPLTSSSSTNPTCEPIKSSTTSDKFKLSLVQSLNTKEISSQLSTIKMQSDSIQSMTLFYSGVALMVCVGTYGMVSLIEKFKSLLLSRVKLRLPLKVDEYLCPPGALIYADFVFYNVESIRGCKSVLDVVCLSSRCPHHFLRRSRRPPLDVFQCFINIAKRDGHQICRVRVDEDGALAKSYEFNKLLLSNNIQIETTAGYASKLNKIVERPNRDHHAKTRIALGLQSFLGTEFWCSARDYVIFIKRSAWHSGVNSAPYLMSSSTI